MKYSSTAIFERQKLEEYVPVLNMIASNLVNNPEWSLRLLDTTTRQLMAPMYRHHRDVAADVPEAIAAAEELVRLCPDCVADIATLAQLLARAERLEESLAWADRAISKDAGEVEHHRLRASILERLGRLREAQQTITAARENFADTLILQEDANRIDAHLIEQLRHQRDVAADVQEAIAAAEELVRLCPDCVADIAALAQLLARAERLEESLAWVDRAISKDAGEVEHHRLRASILERLGRYRAALESAAMALQISPGHPMVMMDLRRIRKYRYLRASGLLYVLRLFSR